MPKLSILVSAKKNLKAKEQMARKKTNKKSQVWLSDYTLSMLLFILAALIAVKIIINSFSANTDFQELRSESSKISEILLSEGFPVNNDTVIRPGLLTGKRLDETKVAQAMDSTYINYTSLKTMLQTKHDFLVIFQQTNSTIINFTSLCAIGKPSVSIWDGISCSAPNFNNIDHKNMVQLNRLVIYNSSIVRMVVYAWN
jgi:hypothetical protein